jgi:hypothetical protein
MNLIRISIASVLLCFAILLLSLPTFGQYEKKALEAVRLGESLRIDGFLDEAVWKDVPVATDFIMDAPLPGMPQEQKTDVKVVYDHEALYIGFMCYDSAPDSILHQLCGRDQTCNTDYCGVIFSCYRDGINGFTFFSSPNGEQYDARTDNNGDDVSWNAVWYSKARITDKGWSVEMKIPFAALRFQNSAELTWNINFVRDVRRTRHHAYWNGVDLRTAGLLTQMGTLTGIRNIDTPRRVFFYPYTSGYVNTAGDGSGARQSSGSYNYGLDLKLGLSDAFTLDATLIPDFGQTISDQNVLNLSAYELQFADNRQFFTEGTELFSRAGIFYSRRIGFETPLRWGAADSQLQSNEVVSANPGKDRIANAMKISGRNKNKLGIGFFNAVTLPSEAIVTDTLTGATRSVNTSNLTNYNVTVLDQVLPNNSFVSLINTSVLRGGGDYDADVLGTAFEIRSKSNVFSISGSGSASYKSSPYYRQKGVDDQNGFRQDVSLNKISGNWTCSVGQYAESNTYDPNDLGFLAANNSIGAWLYNSYAIYKPFGRFNRMWSDLNVLYNNLYLPRKFTDITMEASGGITTRKFNTYGFNASGNPVRGFDYFEPRVWGSYFRTYTNVFAYVWYSSDYRKKVALDLGAGYGAYENVGRYRFNWRVAPRFRFNDHLFMTYVYSYQSHVNDLGYAYAFEDEAGTQPLFGKRDVISHTNVLTLNYAFNAFMTLNTRVRHYWGFTKFNAFYSLLENGDLAPSDATAYNQSFNTFTIDLMYTWIFTPGSQLSLVWKNNITGFDSYVPTSLGTDLDYTFALPQNNSYSLKFIYFLDYHKVRDVLR